MHDSGQPHYQGLLLIKILDPVQFQEIYFALKYAFDVFYLVSSYFIFTVSPVNYLVTYDRDWYQ